MQDQVTVWFFLNLLDLLGLLSRVPADCGDRLRRGPARRAAWMRWLPWLGVFAVAAATLPALNCLQRGQVGIVKMYFLLLGLRLIVNGRSFRAWLTGGIVLALPVVLKIVPALPVGFLLFLQFAEWTWQRLRRPAAECARRPAAENYSPRPLAGEGPGEGGRERTPKLFLDTR